MDKPKKECFEKLLQLSAMLRRLGAPRNMREGPRGHSQARALIQIALRDGISQKELMERLGIQPSTMSELMSKLEAGGMIERRPIDDDRRQISLHINETGRRYLEHINDSQEQLLPFDALNEDELVQLSGILDKLIEGACQVGSNLGLGMRSPCPMPPIGELRPFGGFEGSPHPHEGEFSTPPHPKYMPRRNPRNDPQDTPERAPRHLPMRPSDEHAPHRLPNMNIGHGAANDPQFSTEDDSDNGPQRL